MIVEGVKVVTKHTKANPVTGVAGGIQKVEALIHVSNVAIVDPETKKSIRVGFREETVERNGKTCIVRVRYAKSSGKDI